MQRLILIAVVLVGLCASGYPSRADDPHITLTIATWGAQSHPHEKEFVNRFIAAAERESGGRLSFKYFPNGSMVKQDSVVTAVPGGLVDIALMIIDSWAGIDQNVSVTTTPLWTLSMQDATTQLAVGMPLFTYFSDLLARSQVRLLCLFDIGPPVIASRFSLTRPSDLQGKVIRALSKGTAEDLQALGASPIVMSVGQVYSSLQRHTVDGAMNGVQGSLGLRYYEVAGFEMATGGVIGTIVSGYVMNRRKFESLPGDLQTAITKAAAETREYTQAYINRTYPDYLRDVADKGVSVFELRKDTPAWTEWQSALAAFKDNARKQYAPDLLKLLPP